MNLNFDNKISIEYLDQLCDTLAKAQMNLMQTKEDDPEKQSDITKQLTGINSLLTSAMRFRNVMRKLKK
jgi:hypothetical protein